MEDRCLWDEVQRLLGKVNALTQVFMPRPDAFCGRLRLKIGVLRQCILDNLRHDVNCINVKAEVTDENGLIVPNADNPIEFKVEGEGILIGTDNGNPLDKTRMKSNKRTAFNGLALAVIQSTEKSGSIHLTAVSPVLKMLYIKLLHINK